MSPRPIPKLIEEEKLPDGDCCPPRDVFHRKATGLETLIIAKSGHHDKFLEYLLQPENWSEQVFEKQQFPFKR